MLGVGRGHSMEALDGPSEVHSGLHSDLSAAPRPSGTSQAKSKQNLQANRHRPLLEVSLPYLPEYYSKE